MNRDTEKSRNVDECKTICGSSREDNISIIRNKARQLREASIQLDRLADELSRFSFSQDADEALWRYLTK